MVPMASDLCKSVIAWQFKQWSNQSQVKEANLASTLLISDEVSLSIILHYAEIAFGLKTPCSNVRCQVIGSIICIESQ